MNREKMIEAITTAILGKTAPKAAAAVLDLCGPKKLVWLFVDKMQAWVDEHQTGFLIYENGGEFYLCPPAAKREPHPTLAEAEAAAKAHADAAHWANTVIGASQ